MAAITPKNGRVAFVAAWDPHTYWELNTTNLGTNYGSSGAGNGDNTLVASGDISTSDSYEGMNNRNDDGAGSPFDTLVVTDAAMLLYLPSSTAAGTSYGLWHNGGGTHAQAGWISRVATGWEVVVHHNQGGSNGDHLAYIIPNADLDGWHTIGFQFSSEGGAQGDMGLWVNGTKVAHGTRSVQITYGSGDPDFGYSNSDVPLVAQGISPYAMTGSYSKTAIDGSGVLIANFTADNPTATNTAAPGNGDSFYTDYSDAHMASAFEGSELKAWDGGAWVAGRLKRYDGSEWAPAIVWRYNGASWEVVP